MLASTVSRLTWATKSVCTIAAGVPGVLLGAGLVAQDAERQHRGADRAVLGDDRLDQRCMGREVVGVEFTHVHGGGARRPHGRDLVVELVGASGRSNTVAPDASRVASSSPISLRPPKITISSAPVSFTAVIMSCATVSLDGEGNHPAHQRRDWRFSPNGIWPC